jgi:hypothetical protein
VSVTMRKSPVVANQTVITGEESRAVLLQIGLRDNTTCGATSTLAAIGGERVRALQHALYRAAKADPN